MAAISINELLLQQFPYDFVNCGIGWPTDEDLLRQFDPFLFSVEHDLAVSYVASQVAASQVERVVFVGDVRDVPPVSVSCVKPGI